MIINYQTPEGYFTREATIDEIKTLAKQGNITAIKHLVDLKGGLDNLNDIQFKKVIDLIIGNDVEL